VIHSAFMQNMVWLRVPGDIVFAAGTVFLALFVLRLMLGTRTPATADSQAPSPATPPAAKV
jgi:nitric oxide reductase subunit B